MNSWFTVEKIDSSTYAISEYGHWEKVHSYLLMGQECACLIDTGLGIGNIKEVVCNLTNLPIKVLTTHVHWDHIGGHRYFKEIYVHKKDTPWLMNGIPIPLDIIRRNVLQEPLTKPLPDAFDIENYFPYKGAPSSELEDNDIIDLGNRKLKIMHTPGHCPGHICIYEKEKGYLYTGDLIYKGTLFAFYPSTDPIAYCNSVEKICSLEKINKVLPGHNDLDIDQQFMLRVKCAFKSLKEKDLLKHGTGTHIFEDFKIQL